jgi:hypothetical protein
MGMAAPPSLRLLLRRRLRDGGAHRDEGEDEGRALS